MRSESGCVNSKSLILLMFSQFTVFLDREKALEFSRLVVNSTGKLFSQHDKLHLRIAHGARYVADADERRGPVTHARRAGAQKARRRLYGKPWLALAPPSVAIAQQFSRARAIRKPFVFRMPLAYPVR
jgi:hypothetical protein